MGCSGRDDIKCLLGEIKVVRNVWENIAELNDGEKRSDLLDEVETKLVLLVELYSIIHRAIILKRA